MAFERKIPRNGGCVRIIGEDSEIWLMRDNFQRRFRNTSTEVPTPLRENSEKFPIKGGRALQQSVRGLGVRTQESNIFQPFCMSKLDQVIQATHTARLVTSGFRQLGWIIVDSVNPDHSPPHHHYVPAFSYLLVRLEGPPRAS